MSADPFERIRCGACGKVHWPQLPCLADDEQRDDDLLETGLVGAAEARGGRRMNKAEKALRIIAERRLTVDLVGDPGRPGLIAASCRGESDAEVYRLGWRPDRERWGCTCEANAKFHRVCSHLLALQMVVVKS